MECASLERKSSSRKEYYYTSLGSSAGHLNRFYTHVRGVPTYCTVFYIPPMIYTYNIPNGFRTFSLATRAATSPPFCKAIAPMIAYNEVVRTTSIPDDSSFWTWIILALPIYQITGTAYVSRCPSHNLTHSHLCGQRAKSILGQDLADRHICQVGQSFKRRVYKM